MLDIQLTTIYSDKAGRSVPAPGRGALTVAREVPSKHPMSILDLAYRSRQLNFRRTQISEWLTHETAQLREEVELRKSDGEAVDDEYFSSRVSDIELEAARQEKDALATYGMLEGTDARISPLRRALAVWGLTGDDIGVLSIHGTSTGANVRNIDYISRLCTDFLYRRRTRPKFGTRSSHPWLAQTGMLYRLWHRRVCLVTLRADLLLGRWRVSCNQFLPASFRATGILSEYRLYMVSRSRPDEHTLSNIDAMFQQHTFLMFPAVPVHTDGIRAGVMSSFGFGQVGGTALVLHPRYLFGALTPSQYATYKSKNVLRGQQAYKSMTEMMITNSLVKIKEAPPFTPELEIPVLMNSLARATLDPKTGSYAFTNKQLPKGVTVDGANSKTVSDIVAGTGSAAGVGVDQGMPPRCTYLSISLTPTFVSELISSVPSHNPTFVARNFTPAEISYCNAQPSPPSSFAARWVGKEAVFKSLNVRSKGAAAAMLDIEILPNAESGAPEVTLHGDAQKAAAEKGVDKVLISLSHSEVCLLCSLLPIHESLLTASSSDCRDRIRTGSEVDIMNSRMDFFI